MSEIDVQNAKQIRDPMDVLITMSLANADISMTYSGYSMAKVADGELDERLWPMRKLADLQGDGFPLDGSCVLYNASTTPSQANGKLGVRSNVGETVTVTATGNRLIGSLFINVTGAASVSYQGRTTPISGKYVTISVLAMSVTMEFAPASETERVEVISIRGENRFTINNDNLIRATVSLRSDLSVIDPTLPESELNVEVYHPVDIAEEVAKIPPDTPVVYEAGYNGDMSPDRNFYVSGQVTWADNVLTIHAVDGVHFLDTELPPLIVYDTSSESPASLPKVLTGAARYIFSKETGFTQITGSIYNPFYDGGDAYDPILIPKGVTLREAIAEAMNIIRFRNIPSVYIDDHKDRDSFVFNYVDAGRPSVSAYGDDHRKRWTVYEEDCAEIKKSVEPKFGEIKFQRDTINIYALAEGRLGPLYDGVPVGSAQIVKNEGVFISLDDYVYCFMVGIESSKLGGGDYTPYRSLVPASHKGFFYVGFPDFPDSGWRFYEGAKAAIPVFTGETPNGTLEDDAVEGSGEYPVYSQVIPWSIAYPSDLFPWKGLTATWNGLVSKGIIDSSATYYDATIYGYKVSIESDFITVSKGAGGESVEMSGPIIGCSHFWRGQTKGIEAFPKYGAEQLLDRSNITGSFTWKGDPRMQPRDVVEWERLDGTTTTITLENITLTHEGGGTMAEITYREGVV